MIAITLDRAMRAFAKQLACNGVDDEEKFQILSDAVHEGIEFLLISGGGHLKREWRMLMSTNGVVTLPRDLETPVKYKFGTTANWGFGVFNSPYLSYSSYGIDKNCCGPEYSDRFEVLANYSPVQYQPICKMRLCATTRNKKDIGKRLVVSGMQGTMPIAGMHNGKKTSGELLHIWHEDDPNKRYSTFEFDSITNVVKDETCDYVMLSGWTQRTGFEHLAWYHPDETNPQYRQIRVTGCPPCAPNFRRMVHILGRVNPSIEYKRLEDVVPIDSITLLKLLSYRARYEELGDYGEVAAMEVRIQNTIKKLVSYQEVPGKKISIKLGSSPASQSNV